jgi:hypothetical protein
MKQKVVITQKGSEMKTNGWKEGQLIECHPNIAADFIKKGIAIDPDDTEVKEPKKSKK